MVRIDYVDGDTEVVETVEKFGYVGNFHYDEKLECFIVHNNSNARNCITIPREFVKSIRHIEP